MAGWAVVVVLVLRWLVSSMLSPFLVQVLIAVVVLVPALAVLTWAEGGRYQGSPAKQLVGLRVRRADGSALGYPRALLRAVGRVAVPWLLGQAAYLVWVGSAGQLGIDGWIVTFSALGVPLLYLVSMLVDDQRTPYDLLAGSQVVSVASARRAIS